MTFTRGGDAWWRISQGAHLFLWSALRPTSSFSDAVCQQPGVFEDLEIHPVQSPVENVVLAVPSMTTGLWQFLGHPPLPAHTLTCFSFFFFLF